MDVIEVDVGKKSLKFWWVYFGDIPLSWIKVVEGMPMLAEPEGIQRT
jgi:hypothetical protein